MIRTKKCAKISFCVLLQNSKQSILISPLSPNPPWVSPVTLHWGPGNRYSPLEKCHYPPISAAHTKEQQGRHKHARGADYTYSRTKMGKDGTWMIPTSNFFQYLYSSEASSPSPLHCSTATWPSPSFLFSRNPNYFSPATSLLMLLQSF